MRKTLTILAIIINQVNFAQDFRSIDQTIIKSNTTLNENIQTKVYYDSLSNIRPYKDSSYYKKFIGQSILFYPRSPKSELSIKYYANFKIPNERIVSIDTIWHKKRKNPKPQDYEINVIRSNRYKPQFIKDEYVTLYAASRSSQEKEGEIYPVDMSGNSEGVYTGYFTPYNEIENKSFKIIDIKHQDASKSTFFTLQSEEGDTIYWQAHRGKYDGQNNKDEQYPIIVLGFIDKMKNIYLNKELYIKDVHPIEKYKCNEITLFGSTNEYLVPSFILKSDNTELTLPLWAAPSMFSYKTPKGPNILFCDLNVTEAKVYENSLEQERIAKLEADKQKLEAEKQKKIAQEKALKQEKIAREQAIKEEVIRKEEREEYIRAKFGEEIADLILSHKVKLGMSKEMVKESWGTPSGGVNRTIGSWGIHEQWVYGSKRYLYFENGTLTTIQD